MEECPRRVRVALRTVPAAYEVGFDVDKDQVYVSYAVGSDVAAMVDVIQRNAGFKAWKKAEGWPGRETIDAIEVLPR